MDWGVSMGSFTHVGACLLKNIAVQGFPRWLSGTSVNVRDARDMN